MDWERAKNYMFFFLVLANLALAYLLFGERDADETLTDAQLHTITQVLHRNNITLETDIPRNRVPARVLQLGGYVYDYSGLLAMFFPGVAVDVREEPMFSATGANAAQLYIRQAYFIEFINYPTDLPRGTPCPDAAFALAGEVMARHYLTFRPDPHTTQVVEDGLRIFFRQEYRGHLIHTNQAEFLIVGDGTALHIDSIEMHYRRTLAFVETLHPAPAPDEALMHFVQRYRRHLAPYIAIRHIDVVLYLPPGLPADETVIAEKHYRIFLAGQASPHIIGG